MIPKLCSLSYMPCLWRVMEEEASTSRTPAGASWGQKKAGCPLLGPCAQAPLLGVLLSWFPEVSPEPPRSIPFGFMAPGSLDWGGKQSEIRFLFCVPKTGTAECHWSSQLWQWEAGTLEDGANGEIPAEQTQVRKDHGTGWWLPGTPASPQHQIHL